MTYEIENIENGIKVNVEGRIDNNTTSELEGVLLPMLDSIDELILNFEKLQYISSAGLRLLLMLQKKMEASDKKFSITNVNDFVMQVFEITKFKNILTIK